MKNHLPISNPSDPKRRGFTLLEMLAVVVIISILLLAMVNVPGIMASSRTSTAMQNLLATMESAHARAMRSQQTVWLCFLGQLDQATLDSSNLEQFREYAIFDVDTTVSPPQFKQVTPWAKLPTGLVFVPGIVQGSAGAQNLFSYELAHVGDKTMAGQLTSDGTQDVNEDSMAVDAGGKGRYPTIKNVFFLQFGPLGQIQFPSSGGSIFQIPVVQGNVVGAEFEGKAHSGNTIVTVKGLAPKAEDCYFVEVHRNTGRSYFLP